MSSDYYADKFSAERLRRVYEIAPPRVKQYLEAEIQHVLSRMPERAAVLELGCGYGRVLERKTGLFAELADHRGNPEYLIVFPQMVHKSLSIAEPHITAGRPQQKTPPKRGLVS